MKRRRENPINTAIFLESSKKAKTGCLNINENDSKVVSKIGDILMNSQAKITTTRTKTNRVPIIKSNNKLTKVLESNINYINGFLDFLDNAFSVENFKSGEQEKNLYDSINAKKDTLKQLNIQIEERYKLKYAEMAEISFLLQNIEDHKETNNMKEKSVKQTIQEIESISKLASDLNEKNLNLWEILESNKNKLIEFINLENFKIDKEKEFVTFILLT